MVVGACVAGESRAVSNRETALNGKAEIVPTLKVRHAFGHALYTMEATS